MVTASPSSPAPLLAATGLARRQPGNQRWLLHPVDLVVRPGDRVMLTGPSGAGKTVLLRALALLDPVDAGQIEWQGRPVGDRDIPNYRRHVAYLRQRPALFDGSVADNLRLPYSLDIYRDQRFSAERINTFLSEAGRSPSFLDQPARDLSGGEAQIVALLRTLQFDPEVLLLDEPTASLDPASTGIIEHLLVQWLDAARDQRAFVWVSHDMAQADRMGNRRLVMQAGQLTQGEHA